MTEVEICNVKVLSWAFPSSIQQLLKLRGLELWRYATASLYYYYLVYIYTAAQLFFLSSASLATTAYGRAKRIPSQAFWLETEGDSENVQMEKWFPLFFHCFSRNWWIQGQTLTFSSFCSPNQTFPSALKYTIHLESNYECRESLYSILFLSLPSFSVGLSCRARCCKLQPPALVNRSRLGPSKSILILPVELRVLEALNFQKERGLQASREFRYPLKIFTTVFLYHITKRICQEILDISLRKVCVCFCLSFYLAMRCLDRWSKNAGL